MINKTYFFMAGLPRSGATVLSAILNQNPLVYSGPSSPVTGIMLLLEKYINDNQLYLSYPKQQAARSLIGNIIANWHSDINKPVIIDKNRSWTYRLDHIREYIGVEPKILCPVRNIKEIVTSFIELVRKNKFQGDGKINFIDEQLIKSSIPMNDMNRFMFLVSAQGVIGEAYNGMKDLVEKGITKNLHFIEYDDLVTDPEKTMEGIYNFLELDNFKHDFSKLENKSPERDFEVHGLKGMHDVRPKLAKTSSNPEDILSKEILDKCENSEFWRDLDIVDIVDHD